MGGQKNRRTEEQTNKGGAALDFRVDDLFQSFSSSYFPPLVPLRPENRPSRRPGGKDSHSYHTNLIPTPDVHSFFPRPANALPLISSLSSPSALFSSPSASIVIVVAPLLSLCRLLLSPLHPTMQWRHASRASFLGPRRSPTTSPAADRMSLPSRPPTTSPGLNRLLCNSPPAMHLSRGPRPRPRRRPPGMPATTLAARVRASR